MKEIAIPENNPKYLVLIANEVEAMLKLSHPNIIKIKDHFSPDPRKYAIIMTFAESIC
jgi:serine/threonine protein kinase